MKHFWLSLYTILLVTVLAACSTAGPTPNSTPPVTACTTVGTGTLQVTISGLPASVAAKVAVTGGSFNETLTASQTLNVAGGNYTISAEKVSEADPLVRKVYRPTVTASPACVRDGQSASVTVNYGLIPTSNKLWVGSELGMAGFASALLGATATQSASVTAETVGAKGLTFDKDGNFWVLGGTTSDPLLARYNAADWANSSAKTPDIRIDAISTVTCFPPTNALAFDAAGNLWVVVPCDQKILKLTVSQLVTAETVAPAVVLSGLEDPQSVAFDATGNLWVADGATLKRYNASRLISSTSTPADLTLSSETPAPSIVPLGVDDLAFDESGNLWVMAFGNNILYKLTPAEQGATGSQSVTPAIQISISVSALLEDIAFDESGGLWLTYSAGKIARLSSAQLTVSSSSGSPTIPETILTSSDIGFAASLALYPAPTGLPLYHSLPE
jgi:sugar lactone lactonase YvrE